jgi:hypothetical protein
MLNRFKLGGPAPIVCKYREVSQVVVFVKGLANVMDRFARAVGRSVGLVGLVVWGTVRYRCRGGWSYKPLHNFTGLQTLAQRTRELSLIGLRWFFSEKEGRSRT